jgi:hypothetical protein
MAKDANDYGNTSASGHGAYGHGSPWSHQYVGPPTFGSLPPENAESNFGGDSSSEAPRQILEDSASVILPFQPRVYQENSDWYFEFTTSGVVFLPVATETGGTIWHNHWNEAWPFRPKMTDTSGSLVDINDVHAYDPPSTDTRRPRLLLTEGERNVIYLKVSLEYNEDSISRRPDATGGFGEGVIIKTPELSLFKSDGSTNNVNTTSEFEESSPAVESDFEAHSHAVNPSNFAIKYDSGGSATIHGDGVVHPLSFVPLGERNYYVITAPEIKVVKANDGDSPADTPLSVKHNDWNNEDSSRVFPWGSIYLDDSTSPATPKIEWWRYDCPTYNFNNRTVDTGTSPTVGKHPKDHSDREDGNLPNLTAPNDNGLNATI